MPSTSPAEKPSQPRDAHHDLCLVPDLATALGIDRRTLAGYLAADNVPLYTFLRYRYVIDWPSFLLWFTSTDREKIVSARNTPDVMQKLHDVKRGKRW